MGSMLSGKVTLEICVDAGEDARMAAAGGADRIELCAALGLGGLSPSAGLLAGSAALDRPVVAMVRPRDGGFIYCRHEARELLADIAAAKAAGASGVAMGALTPDDAL